MKKDVKRVVANSGQWLSCVLLSMGIFIEVVYCADIGFIIITSGSMVFAIFTKIKYFTRKK